MIETLQLHDFKGHRDTTVRFAPLTVLVGPNGAGKTSVLEALRYLGQIQSLSPAELFEGPSALNNLVRHASGVWGFSLNVTGLADDAPISIGFDAEALGNEDSGDQAGGAEGLEWRTSLRLTDKTGLAEVGLKWEDKLTTQRKKAFWRALRGVTYLRLDPSQIAQGSLASERSSVGNDGLGVASTLAVLKLTDDPRLGLIVDALRRIVPQVEQVRAVPTTLSAPGWNSAAGYRLVFDLRSGKNIPATSVSEGTLLTLALLTVLHGPTRPKLLLLDDVHEALHPTAQAQLMATLKALTTGPDTIQVIATTHSPFILDAVTPDAVQVFALRDDGTAAVRSLAEHPDAAKYVGALSTGQLWTLDDERNWVLEGNP